MKFDSTFLQSCYVLRMFIIIILTFFNKNFFDITEKDYIILLKRYDFMWININTYIIITFHRFLTTEITKIV